MAVCIMANVSCQPKFLDMILPLGVLRIVQQNMLHVWSDTDFEDMLKTLLAKLQAHVDGKGTWDEYRKELDPSPLLISPAAAAARPPPLSNPFPAASDPPASSPMSCPVSGHGSFSFPDGTQYSGEWANSKPHGRGKMEFTNRSVYEGNFSNGLKEGTGVFKWVTGQWAGDSYVGSYKNDFREGKGVYTYADGRSYDGDWKNDKQEGKGVFTWANGGSYDRWILEE